MIKKWKLLKHENVLKTAKHYSLLLDITQEMWTYL